MGKPCGKTRPYSIMTIMKVERNRTALKKATSRDDCYVDAAPHERIAFIWELTAELWSLKDKQSAERRLQRDVANLIRPQG